MQKLIGILIGLIFVSCSTLLNPSGTNSTINAEDTNISLAQAKVISFEDSVSFKLSSNGLTEYFKITLSKDCLLRALCYQVPSNISLKMELLNSEGTQLANAIAYNPGLNDTLIYNAVMGTYYFKIYNNSWTNSSNPISLIITKDTLDTFEVNNGISTAKPIIFGNQYSAKIIPQGDRDYFSFSLSQPSIVVVNVDSVSTRLSMKVSFLNAEGVTIASYKEFNYGDPMIIPRMLTQGNYYILIQDADNYRFSDKPYYYNISKYTTDTCEWNNDTAYAKSIDAIMTGTIYPLGDVDYFTFTKTDSSKTTISVDSVSTKYSMSVTLLTSELTTITSSYGNNKGDPVSIVRGLKAGKYYIKLLSYSTTSDSYAEKKYYLKMQNN